jgi:hypothetical protein
MPRFGGRATMMRLPFIEIYRDLMQHLSASRWISGPHSVPERATGRAIFVPNR